MGSTDKPSEESEPSSASAPTSLARAFGAGAGHAKAAKVAGVEVLADIVGGILDDPFQSELTRPGGAMDGVIGTTHTAWHEAASVVHHLGGAETETVHTPEHAEHLVHDDPSADLHSTIHDEADHHGHVADIAHDHVVHPSDHPHHDPPH